MHPAKAYARVMDMLDSYKHRLRKAAAAFCAAAFLLGSVPAARAASVCPPPQVSAACAALIDGRTGQTLYEKNADRRALIASTTKIITGLLVCEAGEADRRVTVPSLAVGLEGSSMYLKRGETLTRRDLLYGMMLHSGNDAALTLAISVSGSEQAFVRQMNLRAQALGLRQTHFANPHGLDSGENYSSARDLAMLAQAALQNQQFRTVVGTKTIACAGRTLTNHNKLLWRYDGCIGVKTGYTRHAGRILVSAAERGESQLIAVTLADPDDWRDHAALLDYGFANFAVVSPDLSDCDNQIPVRLGKDAGVSAVPEQDMALLIDKAQKSGVTSEVTLEPTVTAPVSRGQRLGTLTVKSGDLVLKEVPLVAAQEVERLSYGEIYRMVLMRAAMAKADAPETAKIPEKM